MRAANKQIKDNKPSIYERRSLTKLRTFKQS